MCIQFHYQQESQASWARVRAIKRLIKCTLVRDVLSRRGNLTKHAANLLQRGWKRYTFILRFTLTTGDETGYVAAGMNDSNSSH